MVRKTAVVCLLIIVGSLSTRAFALGGAWPVNEPYCAECGDAGNSPSITHMGYHFIWKVGKVYKVRFSDGRLLPVCYSQEKTPKNQTNPRRTICSWAVTSQPAPYGDSPIRRAWQAIIELNHNPWAARRGAQ